MKMINQSLRINQKPKLKKIAPDDKPKPKSKKIAAESVTPKEKSKENIEPKEQLEKHVEIPKEKATEVVSNETENVEPSYEIEHVAAYIKTVDDVETQDTQDGGTKEERIKNIHEAFEINRLECVIGKAITNRLKVDSSTEKIKCLKDILELLDLDFIKVDFTDIMHDNDASDKKDIEDEPVKPKKPEKRVTFKIDTADEKHEEEMSQISKDTEAAIAKLDQVIEVEENKRHRIDAAYINFPSSQEKFDLYKPETEDITDEDEPETKMDTVTGIRTFTKKTDKTKDKDINDIEKKEELVEAVEQEDKMDEEQKKDETENKSEVVQPVEPEPEHKLGKEKKDETENKSELVQPVEPERKLDKEKKDETENKSELVQPAEEECKLDEEEKKDETENESEVVRPVEPEHKIDEKDENEEENESEIVKPVEAELKVEETEEKPDDSQVQQTEGVENEITDDGILPETKEDSDADSNSNLALTER